MAELEQRTWPRMTLVLFTRANVDKGDVSVRLVTAMMRMLSNALRNVLIIVKHSSPLEIGSFEATTTLLSKILLSRNVNSVVLMQLILCAAPLTTSKP